MPTYEYKCIDCGVVFEKFQSMLAEPLTECPECKGKVKRLLGSGAGIIFKGSGFYETDYRKPEYEKKAKEEKKKVKSGSNSESDGGGKQKTETPATSNSDNGKKENTSGCPAN